MQIPSLGFVLRCSLEEIESNIDYYQSCLELNTGSFLSADHSHKVAKVIISKVREILRASILL
jgi:hypothetical protein